MRSALPFRHSRRHPVSFAADTGPGRHRHGPCPGALTCHGGDGHGYPAGLFETGPTRIAPGCVAGRPFLCHPLHLVSRGTNKLLNNSGCSKIVRSSHPQEDPRRRSSATPHKAAFENGGEMAVFNDLLRLFKNSQVVAPTQKPRGGVAALRRTKGVLRTKA